MISKFSKKFNLVLKLFKLYLFGPSIFLQFNFGMKACFYYFLVLNLRERERERDSSGRDRKSMLTPI